MTRFPDWQAPVKPAEAAYNRLIDAILDGSFPANSVLPAERQLAEMLGVTRSTLRETLQRLAAEGWVDIQHGKPTRVRDIRVEGKLNTLAALVDHYDVMPTTFIPRLLEVRLALAPAYTGAAVAHNAGAVAETLGELLAALEETSESYARTDWVLHHRLTVLSTNPIFTLILNGFEGFYEQMALIYFKQAASRHSSLQFYQDLSRAAAQSDSDQARAITGRVMQHSIELWDQAAGHVQGGE